MTYQVIFRDSSSSSNSGLKVIIPDEHSEPRGSGADKKRKTSEPVGIGKILPDVMADIKK
jgi:hypothetical protein